MKKRNETLVGYAFVAPALIVFVALVAFPLLFSIFLSFTEWNFLSGWDNIKFAGLNNFRKLLADNGFRWGLKNTFIYTAAVVPASIIIALVLAYLLNDKVYTKKTLRLCFFIPYISNAVALAAVFKAMFREDGVINYILMRFFGMQEAIRWFTNSQFNKIPIIIFVIWVQIGFELIIYMAALQNVPRELYEAAELDGATPWKKFWRITFPLISPTTFYLVVVQLIAVFKIFSAIDVMNFGQTAYSNTSIVVEIYKNAFQHYNFGYASAESLVLLVIIIIATAINFIGQKKWVHY
ncbi:MAG: sugar ABC transporter permease [Oscillospiraceae bacterium]|jgi:multiple sugar transport system permease protein|nr:sugar ABC transporter permease [Oscillospiraceae bacterium]